MGENNWDFNADDVQRAARNLVKKGLLVENESAQFAAAPPDKTAVGRIVGPILDWVPSDVHTVMLRTADGKETPLIIHGSERLKQCKRNRDLIVEGWLNLIDGWGLLAGTALEVATIRRAE